MDEGELRMIKDRDESIRLLEQELKNQYLCIEGAEERERNIRANLAKAIIERDRLRQLIRLAHPVMRECGWHLASAAEPISDGVLEAACSEIEQKFAEELQGVRTPTDVDKLRKALKTFETMVRDDDYDAGELIEEFAGIARKALEDTE